MAKKVYIDVIVDDKGTTRKVAVDTQKLGANLEKTSKGAHSADRALKGAAQASSNTTKNFSKMSQGITGGLVPAYATLAANLFAISAAFQFLKRAGDLAALERSQTEYAYKTGISMKLLTSRLQEATGQLLTFDEAAQAAAIGTAAGLSSGQLESLAEIASKASAALGRDLTDSFNRLTRGAIKAEPELLDELGIIVRLDTAVKEYKDALDITGRELTTFEKTQAVVNKTIKEGEKNFGDLSKSTNDIARLGKAVDDLIKKVQKFIVPVATFIANVFTNNLIALGAAATAMGTSLLSAITPAGPALNDISEQAEKAKLSIQSLGGSGKVGQRIAAGQLGPSELRYAEGALRAKKSTVLNLEGVNRAAIKRQIDLIKADQARAVAEMSTGWKKYSANAIAQFKAMQAEHGRVMGAMKAAVGGFARFASRAMNAIAILGVITLAIQLGKELIDLLKDAELKKFQHRMLSLENTFSNQNEEILEMVSNLKLAETPMERLVKRANLLSNFSYTGYSAIQFQNPVMGTREQEYGRRRGGYGKRIQTATPAEGTDEALMAGKAIITSLQLQQAELIKTGANTSELDKKLNTLSAAYNILSSGTVEGKDAVEKYHQAVVDFNVTLPQAVEEVQNLTSGISAQAAALNSLAEMATITDEIFKGFRPETGPLGQYTNQLIRLREVFKTLAPRTVGEKTFAEQFSQQQIEQIETILGVTDLAQRKLREIFSTGDGGDTTGIIGALDPRIRDLEEEQVRQLTEKLNIERDYEKSKMAFLPFLQEEARLTREIALLNSELADIAFQREFATDEKGFIDPVLEASLDAQVAKINAMKDALRLAASDMGKIGANLGESLESGLGKALNDIVVGASSAKEAFANMAKGMIQSLAQVITKLLAVKLIEDTLGRTGFGSFLGLGARSGAITEPVPGYAGGGIARGREAGYPAILHGTEAVVPLPNGKEIPVQMRNGGGDNNVVVNVNMDGSSSQESAQGGDQRMKQMGRAISQAVQEELQKQKRPGGILSPYGAA